MSTQGKLIAVCGVDGSGKSTVVTELEKRQLVANASYARISKQPPSNRYIVNKYCRRSFGDGRDWLEGAYAESIGVGLAFDFLNHYDKHIRPEIDAGKTVVCDRYTPCFICYLEAIRSSFASIQLYSKVKQPDIVCYVNVPEAVRITRLEDRGDKQHDEHPEVLRRFDAAYRAYFNRSALQVVHVENSGPIVDTIDKVNVALQSMM